MQADLIERTALEIRNQKAEVRVYVCVRTDRCVRVRVDELVGVPAYIIRMSIENMYISIALQLVELRCI